MVRIAISVEGTTEERFVKTSLVSFFFSKNIQVHPISIQGNVSVARIKNEIEKLAYSFDYVTTMYDFYGFKGKTDGETKSSLEKKISYSLKPEIKKRFVPYIQMYEFESLLFSSPNAIGSVFGDEKYTLWAERVLNDFQNNPELINNSKETAPSKRFIQYTPYKKTIDGPNIAIETGMKTLRARCAGFNDWITDLESLA